MLRQSVSYMTASVYLAACVGFACGLVALTAPMKDVCDSDTFKPRCADNEVIVVEGARYGREKGGGCVHEDIGHFGCVHDVLSDVDSACSGRRTCELKVDDANFKSVKTPCHNDLKSHLRIAYTCVPVISAPESCKTLPKPVILKESSGNIASIVTEETNCGSTEAPWVIQSKQGQKVNITLLDFTYDVSVAKPEVSGSCKVLAVIRDRGKTLTVCGGDSRYRKVFESQGDLVQIRVLSTPDRQQTGPKFILTYQVTGCPDPPKTQGGWTSRSHGNAKLYCDGDTQPRWTLVCHGTRWQGNHGNCSSGDPAFLEQVVKSVTSLPYGISIAMVVAIAFVVSCLILVIGVICLKWRYTRQMQREGLACDQYPARDSGVPDGGSGKPSCKSLPTNHSPPLAGFTAVPGGVPGLSDAGQRANDYAGVGLLRPDATDAASHGFNNKRYPDDIYSSSPGGAVLVPPSAGAYRAVSEHTYESPDVCLRNYGRTEGSISPQYFDLDPHGSEAKRKTCGHHGYCTCAGTPRDPLNDTRQPKTNSTENHSSKNSNSYSY